eukprot:CAMPEP_0117442190 /NCGR_PEP_ID=MMETSP0759-20121206/4022_1 /TAXON_ID=63605 /ORGANISM="Percolomonas cosmopolitus, Strain WS" /LENGTH=1044 /DNA_ID=CAMNT_0005234067 /DNA_START=290 /DNA_END=3421 /DNA_ORIENTATION=+
MPTSPHTDTLPSASQSAPQSVDSAETNNLPQNVSHPPSEALKRKRDSVHKYWSYCNTVYEMSRSSITPSAESAESFDQYCTIIQHNNTLFFIDGINANDVLNTMLGEQWDLSANDLSLHLEQHYCEKEEQQDHLAVFKGRVDSVVATGNKAHFNELRFGFVGGKKADFRKHVYKISFLLPEEHSELDDVMTSIEYDKKHRVIVQTVVKHFTDAKSKAQKKDLIERAHKRVKNAGVHLEETVNDDPPHLLPVWGSKDDVQSHQLPLDFTLHLTFDEMLHTIDPEKVSRNVRVRNLNTRDLQDDSVVKILRKIQTNPAALHTSTPIVLMLVPMTPMEYHHQDPPALMAELNSRILEQMDSFRQLHSRKAQKKLVQQWLLKRWLFPCDGQHKLVSLRRYQSQAPLIGDAFAVYARIMLTAGLGTDNLRKELNLFNFASETAPASSLDYLRSLLEACRRHKDNTVLVMKQWLAERFPDISETEILDNKVLSNPRHYWKTRIWYFPSPMPFLAAIVECGDALRDTAKEFFLENGRLYFIKWDTTLRIQIGVSVHEESKTVGLMVEEPPSRSKSKSWQMENVNDIFGWMNTVRSNKDTTSLLQETLNDAIQEFKAELPTFLKVAATPRTAHSTTKKKPKKVLSRKGKKRGPLRTSSHLPPVLIEHPLRRIVLKFSKHLLNAMTEHTYHALYGNKQLSGGFDATRVKKAIKVCLRKCPLTTSDVMKNEYIAHNSNRWESQPTVQLKRSEIPSIATIFYMSASTVRVASKEALSYSLSSLKTASLFILPSQHEELSIEHLESIMSTLRCSQVVLCLPNGIRRANMYDFQAHCQGLFSHTTHLTMEVGDKLITVYIFSHNVEYFDQLDSMLSLNPEDVLPSLGATGQFNDAHEKLIVIGDLASEDIVHFLIQVRGFCTVAFIDTWTGTQKFCINVVTQEVKAKMEEAISLRGKLEIQLKDWNFISGDMKAWEEKAHSLMPTQKMLLEGVYQEFHKQHRQECDKCSFASTLLTKKCSILDQLGSEQDGGPDNEERDEDYEDEDIESNATPPPPQ